MVLSSSQQLVMAFTAVLLVFVLFPRMFGGRDGQSFEPRVSRRGADPSEPTSAVFVYSLALRLPVYVTAYYHVFIVVV